MPKRVQSPHSINVFRECARKYWYMYIEGLPTTATIHTVRGNIAHTVLEKFFDQNIEGIDRTNCHNILQKSIFELLLQEWNNEELKKLGLTAEENRLYFEETAVMLFNWLHEFTKKLAKTGTFQEAFQKLAPLGREGQFHSERLSVQGFIDYIEHQDGKVSIMDYKTSAKPDITDDYHLQLGIYALLYKEKHGKLPDNVGIYFLRYGPKTLAVDQKLLDFAIREVELVHKRTESEKFDDYPKNVTHKCRWCDFYSTCFEQKSLKQF